MLWLPTQDTQLNALFVDAELPAKSHLLMGLARSSAHTPRVTTGTFMGKLG